MITGKVIAPFCHLNDDINKFRPYNNILSSSRGVAHPSLPCKLTVHSATLLKHRLVK